VAEADVDRELARCHRNLKMLPEAMNLHRKRDGTSQEAPEVVEGM